MILLLTFFSALMLTLNASLVSFLAGFASPAHLFCLQQVPATTEFAPWISAIVCATHISATATRADLQSLGVIHIFVVSGLQLVIFDRALQIFFSRAPSSPFTTRLIDIALIIIFVAYAALTGCQAPLVRALFQFGLRRLSLRLKLFWRPAQIILISGLLTVMFATNVLSSLALQIGWLASLAFALARINPLRGGFAKHAIFYVVMIVPFLPLGVPHPISILCNWLLMPTLSLILFPLSAATVMFHSLAPLADFTWRWFLAGAARLNDLLTPLDLKQSLPAFYGWAYLIALQLFLLFYEREPCVS